MSGMMGRAREEPDSITLPLLMCGDPVVGILESDGSADSAPTALRRRLDAGELDHLEFEAVTFRAHYPNSNFYRFRDEELDAFAASFRGQPFLRNHDVHDIGARDGTITGARLEGDRFRQTVRLTTERGLRDYVNGVIDRFSIGWYYAGVTCSVCGEEWFACAHWPGKPYHDGAGESLGRCELIFEQPRGKETSAVNAPAVAGTGILAGLAQLTTLKERRMAEQPTIFLPNGAVHPVAPKAAATGDVPGLADTLSTSTDPPGSNGVDQLADPPISASDSNNGTQSTVDPNPDLNARLGELEQALDRVGDVEGRIDRLLRQAESERLDAALERSGLSPDGRHMLRLAIEGQPTVDESRLSQLIEAQRQVEAAFVGQGLVRGVNPLDGRASGMLDSLDKLRLAVDGLLSGVRPEQEIAPLTGVRELYIMLSGDYDMWGRYRPENVGLANVNSATMAGLVADALNKRVVNMFQQYPRFWESLVIEEDFHTLQQVKWITLGGIGELPTVAEGAAYTEAVWDDQTETGDWTKKGSYLGLTLEAIDKDDTSRLQQAPRALSQAAYMTFGKVFSRIFQGNAGVGPTMSDGVALFHATHANLGSTALTQGAWETTKIAMRKQTELNSGERLGALVVPRYVMVPPDLEFTALVAMASELAPGVADNDINPHAAGSGHDARLAAARRQIVVNDFLTDPNDWVAVADPMLYPSVGVGWRFGRSPEIFAQADPNSGLMFTNDTMPIKVRWFFVVGPTDWRGLYKHNVA